jgi:hypothetical protein
MGNHRTKYGGFYGKNIYTWLTWLSKMSPPVSSLLIMMILYSYVKLPEGTYNTASGLGLRGWMKPLSVYVSMHLYVQIIF